MVISTDSYADDRLANLRAPEHDGDAVGDVLRDQAIGNYDVRRLHNPTTAEANLFLEDMFQTAHLDDGLVLYLSGHGLRDADGRLYFAMTDTRVNRLGSTAVSSHFVKDQIDRSRSRRIVVLLDCCYSGAFPSDLSVRSGGFAEPPHQLTGRGSAVIAASTELEYAFEPAAPSDPPRPAGDGTDQLAGLNSVFTAALVHGLRTGAADLDGDGLVDVAELYEYLTHRLSEGTHRQTPTFVSRVQGSLFVAFNPLGARPADSGQSPPSSPPAASGQLTIDVSSDGKLSAQLGRRQFIVGAAGLIVYPRLTDRVPARRWDIDVTEGVEDPFDFARAMRMSWPGIRLHEAPNGSDADWHASFPGGRIFAGGSAAIQIYPAIRATSGAAVIHLTELRRIRQFLERPHRALVVGAVRERDDHTFYALDRHAALRQLRRSGHSGTATLTIPSANELDDFSYGVLWAAANLDDALTADDAGVAQTRRDLRAYDDLGTSALSREIASDLNPVSLAWLGSDFCARYILSQLGNQSEVPLFWTREQTGEEASMWLLVQHKANYLRRTRYGAPGTTTQSSRGFCVPEQVVRYGSRAERLLLFLAMALMEAHNIRVDLCIDPSFSAVEGFVLLPGKRALVANWVRAEGLWHVDSRSNNVALREFSDVLNNAEDTSVVRGVAVAPRMIYLADYLGLEPGWLVARCREFARSGWSPLVRPRSRLLSTTGVDTACRFVASLPGMSVGGM